jgi:hypothetical protein
MMSPHLPSVLQGTNGQSSISTERALKQIKDLVESILPTTQHDEDMVQAALDDLDMMLQSIDRNGD